MYEYPIPLPQDHSSDYLIIGIAIFVLILLIVFDLGRKFYNYAKIKILEIKDIMERDFEQL